MKWILKQLKALWAWLCSVLDVCWNWLLARNQERWFYLCFALVVASFSAITLRIEWAIVPAASLGFIWEFFRMYRKGEFRWKNFICWCIGGGIVWIIQLL